MELNHEEMPGTVSSHNKLDGITVQAYRYTETTDRTISDGPFSFSLPAKFIHSIGDDRLKVSDSVDW